MTSANSPIDAFTEFCGKFTAWTTLAMLLCTCFVVVARYLFGSGSIALQEFDHGDYSVAVKEVLVGERRVAKHLSNSEIPCINSSVGITSNNDLSR